jgi:hypothetical protein
MAFSFATIGKFAAAAAASVPIAVRHVFPLSNANVGVLPISVHRIRLGLEWIIA